MSKAKLHNFIMTDYIDGDGRCRRGVGRDLAVAVYDVLGDHIDEGKYIICELFLEAHLPWSINLVCPGEMLGHTLHLQVKYRNFTHFNVVY